MFAALLLIGSVLQPPAEKLPTLFIRLGDNHESSLLKSELTRDWTRLRSYQPSHIFHAFAIAHERKNTKAKIEFITVDRWAGLKTPAYKIGRYGRWELFDRRAFAFTGRPTRTVKWIIDWHEAERSKAVWMRIDTPRAAFWDYRIVPVSLPKPPWEKAGQ